MTELIRHTSGLVVAETPVVTADQLSLVKQTIAHGATDAELKLYLYDCARQGVHPLDRLLHFTKRGGKYTPVTSIDLMRTRAADTGEYAGSDDAVFECDDVPIPPTLARVTVWRLVQGQRCAFTATARWMEYCPSGGQDHMWRKMPHTMLAKCAEALALRKGFPRQLAGLYAKEEMDQAGQETPRQEPPHAAPVQAKVETRPVPPRDTEVTDNELPPPPVISEAQRKRFFAISKSKGWSTEGVKALLESYGFLSSTGITKEKYEAICAALESGQEEPADMPSAEDIFDGR